MLLVGGVEDVGLAVQRLFGEDLHVDEAVVELAFEGLQGLLPAGGGEATHQLGAEVLDEAVAASEGLFTVVDVGAVGGRLHLVLQRVEQLLRLGRGDHPDEDPGGGAGSWRGGRFGVDDVGEGGPAAQVEVAGGHIDGVEVLQGVDQGQPEPGVVGDVVEDVGHCWFPLVLGGRRGSSAADARWAG